jgi:hypothetical protein
VRGGRHDGDAVERDRDRGGCTVERRFGDEADARVDRARGFAEASHPLFARGDECVVAGVGRDDAALVVDRFAVGEAALEEAVVRPELVARGDAERAQFSSYVNCLLAAL